MVEGNAAITVFAGPCLPPSDPSCRELLDGLDVRPPAQRGDVLEALSDHPRVLVLLDGYYRTVPAVTHKELLYALDSGVRVVGAASMGALRAAELEACGMVGVGTVFEWFRDGRIEGDDEVAIVHAPEDFEYRPSTVALVELRFWLEAAVRRGQVDGSAARELVAKVQALPFYGRSAERIATLASGRIDPRSVESLVEALSQPVLKRRDTRQALEVAHRLAGESESESAEPRRVMAPTSRFLGHYRSWHLGPGPDLPTYQQAWSLVQLVHPQARDFVRQLHLRFLLVSAAIQEGLEPSPEVLESLESRLFELLCSPAGVGPRLPMAEIAEEARQHALAEMARRTMGIEGACGALARGFGLEVEDPETELLEWLVASQELLPAWYRIRAFACSSIREPALQTSREGLRIWGEFREETGVAELERRDLERLVARWWDCSPEEVAAEAGRRGLFETDRFVEDWQTSAERWVVAELAMSRGDEAVDWDRLLGPYPRLRATLLGTPIRHVLEGSRILEGPPRDLVPETV